METRNYKVTWMKDSQSRIEMEYFNIQGANAMYKALKKKYPNGSGHVEYIRSGLTIWSYNEEE